MTAKYKTCSALKVVLLFISLSGLFPANLSGDEGNKYLEAVKEFADNVLKYGRDTYGPKHTPLFVDGLNIHTHEPVKWIDPDGTRWILSNFANQQTLLRTLDGLSSITGDAKYRQSATDAIRYAFDHLRTPNGLLYWGGRSAYDASADQVRAWDQHHTFKLNYPYYELMWKVDSKETKRFIEAYWSAHVNDWSNLDFNRYARLNSVLEEPWNHEYKGGPTFFKSKFGSHGFSNTATSMIQAGTTLYRLSRQEQPLVWSKRLAKRFIDTRHPKTGMSLPYYNNPIPPLGDDLKEHFQNPRTVYFPGQLFEERRRISIRPANSAVLIWLSLILVGDTLGEHGKEFKQWALEELTAWGNVSYRKKDNSFVPILTDGTNIEGYVSKRFTPHSPKGGGIAKTLFADLGFFWGYAVAYRVTSDEFMWEMVRNIAFGNDLGDIGETSIDAPKLRTDTTCSDVYGLLGLLELYAKTNKSEFLKVAQSIGDNIVGNQFYKGFFVPSKRHIYTRFDCFEPLALLHLQAATTSKTGSVPQVWPCYPVFTNPYRHKEIGVDRRTIYTLTESSEPPLSLQEAAAIGDIELVCSLLDKGVGVNSWESPMADTALHRAARSGHKDIVKLLLEKGALVDSLDSWPGATPLHYAAEKGHKEIAELLIANGADVNVKDKRGRTPIYYAAENGHKEIAELLIAKGADVNAKNNKGQMPIDIAVNQNHKDIVELLRTKGADASSLHIAARIGDLAKVKEFLEQGIDVNMKDTRNRTALHYAAEKGHKEIIELLIANGADVNAGAYYGKTAAEFAMNSGHTEIVELLISKGADISPLHFALYMKDKAKAKSLIEDVADVNKRTPCGTTPLHRAVKAGFKDIVELLIAKGADVNAKDNWDWTPLHSAAEEGHKDLVELLIAKGANVNARDGGGRIPLWYAQKKGHTEIAELLRKHGAKE